VCVAQSHKLRSLKKVKKTLNAFFEKNWVLHLEEDDNAAVVDIFVVAVVVVFVFAVGAVDDSFAVIIFTIVNNSKFL
jgi:hypothetical protein